jgi:dienelactone hydrolase
MYRFCFMLQRPPHYPDTTIFPSSSAAIFNRLLGDTTPPQELSLQRGGERVSLGEGLYSEELSYEVEAGEWVKATLFTHEQPRPGVLALHQHGGDEIFATGHHSCCDPTGSATENYAYTLARAGFTVLAPDSICFGERTVSEGYSEGFGLEILTAMELQARGKSLPWKNVYDNRCALTVLGSLSETSSAEYGVIGHSGGSIQGYMLAACDIRVKATAAFQSFITLREQFYGERLYHCLYPYLPGMVDAGIDFDQVVASIVPRKLFMGWGRSDVGTPRSMTEAFVSAVEQESQRQGVESCVQLYASDAGHDVTGEMLAAAEQFFIAHL